MKQMKRLTLCLLLFLLCGVHTAWSQSNPTVVGTVVNETGEPVQGVTVTASPTTGAGESYSTATDDEGIFRFTQLVAGRSYTFRFSHVAFAADDIASFTVRANETNSLVVRMQPSEASALDDVVVVGYGTQRKVNLTGAVSQLGGDEIRDRPVTNISSMLQGAIPNLNITFGGGTPGQMGSINVRGVTGISGNSGVNGAPMVLIDGIPGTLDRLSPEEVQSITVLKDAASAAIYGARGGFGVVLVTTKSGSSGKTSIRYNNSFGFNTPTVSTDFMTSGYDWMSLHDRALSHVNGYSGYTEQDMQELYARRNDVVEDPSRPWTTIQNRNGRDQYVYYGNYNWWDVMFTEWQPNQNHNINISGGNEKVTFMLNGNMKLMDGIMRLHTDKYKSYGLRAKISAELYPWLRVSNNSNFYNMNYSYFGRPGGGNANFTHINVHASPAYAPMNPDGTPTYTSGLNSYDIGDGIFALLVGGKARGVERKYEFTNISEAVLTPFNNFRLTGNYSYSMYTDPSFYREAPASYSLYPGEIQTTPRYATDRLTEDQQFNQVHVINVFGEYENQFDRHYFKAMAGFNQEHHMAKKITAARMDVASEDLNDLALATGEQTVAGGSSAYALQGYFYRLNYNYDGKYLIETNGRYDGSSRFPKGQNFGFFPSVSVGWRISQEPFFEPLTPVISDMKLRASVGSLGNQAVSSPYPYISTMSSGTMAYILQGERARYYAAPNPVSGDLTWERVTSYNYGIDLGFLRNRLTLSGDYYIRTTDDMLSNGVKLPNVFGASQPLVNIAELETKGFEIELAWRDQLQLGSRPFRYNFSANVGDSRSFITHINNPTRLTYTLYEGKEIGEIWGYITDGFFETDAEAKTYPIDQTFLNRVRNDNNVAIRAGDLRWVDLDGDGEISSGRNTVDDPGDQRRVGNSSPRYRFAFSGGANWNGFDLNLFFQGLGKMDWYPGNNADRFWGPYSRPYFSFIPADFEKDIYSAENPNAYFPNLMAYVALNANNELRATNNRYMQDLAYIRLKNLTLGYTLPHSLTQRVKVQQFRVFVSGENLMTWTKLRTKYIDPEQAIADPNGRVYPFSKTYSFGIDITF